MTRRTQIRHAAGTVITGDSRSCISTALKAGGLDYGIRRERLMTVPRDGVPQTIIPNRVSLFRDHDNGYLGTVGNDYAIVPNRDVFMPLDALVSSGDYTVDLVGEFGGGRKAFVLLKGEGLENLFDVAENDGIGNYLLFSTAHDGHGSLKGAVIPYRFSCSNAIAGAMRASGVLSLVHNKSMKERMGQLMSFVNEVPGHFAKRCEEFKYLSARKPNLEQAGQYLTKLGASNRVEKVVLGTSMARTVNLKSWWTLYNGYNAYLNHASSTKPEVRLNSVLLGASTKRDTEALDLCLELAC
jgi:hypothetical protein